MTSKIAFWAADSSQNQVDYPVIAASELRGHDHARYLCAMVAPPERRAGLIALYAFNAEIVRACQGSSETTITQMRLKWWYDALDAVFDGAPPHHPVAQALAAAVPMGLERAALKALVEAHADDPGSSPADTLVAREHRAEAQVAPIFLQALSIVAARDPAAEQAARHAGAAWALADDLRSGRAMPQTVRDLHAAAKAHAATAKLVPKAARWALLPMVLADIYLNRVERAGFDLAHPMARRADPGALGVMKLWWAAKRGI